MKNFSRPGKGRSSNSGKNTSNGSKFKKSEGSSRTSKMDSKGDFTSRGKSSKKQNDKFSDDRSKDSKKPFKRFDSDKDDKRKHENRGEKKFKPFNKTDKPGFVKQKSESKYEDYKKYKSPKKDVESEPKSDNYKKHREDGPYKRKFEDYKKEKPFKKQYVKTERPQFKKSKKETVSDDGLIRLNKYISNAGICSRREADEYIKTGVVKVNGEVITELGYKIKPTDKVMFGDRTIKNEKPVYILLNKPKDYITTSKDPLNRKTVMELIQGIKERIYPVGRLDRNTTGLLLLTNDGEIADKLMHPRKKVVKIYHVELDKKFSVGDFQKLTNGLTLEDGFFKPDVISFVEGMDRNHVGIEIHSGKNRIVRRLFEHLEYKVIKLDRVFYAGLTKKGIPRGEWRHLKPEEINLLKMI